MIYENFEKHFFMNEYHTQIFRFVSAVQRHAEIDLLAKVPFKSDVIFLQNTSKIRDLYLIIS